MKKKTVSYWITTMLIVFMLLSGGLAELAHQKDTVAGMALLGYPLYFVTILGFWKVLGAVALLVPGFTRLKEWAYAGVFFDLTGVAASHAYSADYGAHYFHLIVPLVLTMIAVLSWHLRPPSRKLG